MKYEELLDGFYYSANHDSQDPFHKACMAEIKKILPEEQLLKYKDWLIANHPKKPKFDKDLLYVEKDGLGGFNPTEDPLNDFVVFIQGDQIEVSYDFTNEEFDLIIHNEGCGSVEMVELRPADLRKIAKLCKEFISQKHKNWVRGWNKKNATNNGVVEHKRRARDVLNQTKRALKRYEELKRGA